jgi:hypothetical protein
MSKKLFTEAEIILCTYIARFGRTLFNENRIASLEKRSIDSVKMKVANIAAVLKENGHAVAGEVSPLSGVTTGESGRSTNWELVEPLVFLEKQELKTRCLNLLR